MASPDQLLAQQASQTMALMNAIANNTQQAFANREAVQRQELAAGLQVASAISQDQVRKQQISASRQAMSLQMKRFESEEKARRVEENLLPLKARAKEIEYEANILNGTKALVDPFLVEEKAMLQGFVMQNPDKAMEAANVYNSMFGELANKSVSDPTFDINSELPQKKKALREWISQQTQVTTPSNRLAPLQPTGSLMDSMSQPMPQARSISDLAPAPTATPRQSTALTPEQAASASAAFAAIGGNPILFNQNHDPITKTKIDSAIKVSMISGQLPPAEVAQFIPQDKLLEITRVASNRQESKIISSQLKAYGDQLGELRQLKEGGASVDDSIAAVGEQIKILSQRQADIMGYGRQASEGQGAPPIRGFEQLNEEVLNSATNSWVEGVVGRGSDEFMDPSQQSLDDRLRSQIRPYWIIGAIAGQDGAERFKRDIESGGINRGFIREIADGAKEKDVAALFETPEFLEFAKTSGIPLQEPSKDQGQRIGFTGTLSQRPMSYNDTEFGESLRIIDPRSNAKDPDKKRAIKVLKSYLPELILRYATN